MSCECGCGESANGQFRPGHDQRLRVALERRVGGLLALGALVEAAESAAAGRSTGEQLARQVAAILNAPAHPV